MKAVLCGFRCQTAPKPATGFAAVLLQIRIRKVGEKPGRICAEQRERAKHGKRDKQDDQGVFNHTLALFIQDGIHHRPASSSHEFS
jgi:hypothetical protein